MQGRKTSVRGADYVVHLDRPGYPYVWCGRRAETVNRVELGTGDEPAEEHCRTCVRCRAVAMHARLRARDAGRVKSDGRADDRAGDAGATRIP